MTELNVKYARALIEKSRSYGPEDLEEIAKQLEAALDRLDYMQRNLDQANGMVSAMLTYRAYASGVNTSTPEIKFPTLTLCEQGIKDCSCTECTYRNAF